MRVLSGPTLNSRTSILETPFSDRDHKTGHFLPGHAMSNLASKRFAHRMAELNANYMMAVTVRGLVGAGAVARVQPVLKAMQVVPMTNAKGNRRRCGRGWHPPGVVLRIGSTPKCVARRRGHRLYSLILR